MTTNIYVFFFQLDYSRMIKLIKILVASYK
jgi:hypothetical protein